MTGSNDSAASETSNEAAVSSKDGPANTSGKKAGRGGWYTVIMLAVVVLFAQIDRGVISLMVEPIKRDFDLSDTQVSLLIGVAFTLFYVLVGPPVARIADRGFRKSVVATSLAVWSCATALCGFAQNFWQLFLGRAIIGGAEAGSSPASLSMIADVIPREKLPRAYAIYNAGFAGGGALAMALGGFLLGYFGDWDPIQVPGIGVIRNWQLVFIVLGLPGLLFAAAIMITVPEPKRKRSHKPKGYPKREVFAFIANNRAMHFPLLLGVLINSLQSFGSVAWMPAFYERTYGWTPDIVGPLLGGLGLVTAAIGLTIGARFAEWLGKRRDDANLRVLFLANALSIPFIVLQPLMPNPWLALACGGVGTMIAFTGGPAYNSALQLATPNAMRGQVNAMYLFMIAAIGGAFGPLLIALLTDFVAGKEEFLRYVLVGFRLALAPLDAFLIYLAIKPYGRAYRARLKEEQEQEALDALDTSSG